MSEIYDGKKGSKPVEGVQPVGFDIRQPNEPIKFSELKEIAAKIAAAEGTPNYAVLLQDYTGPDTGVVYDDETKTCGVADGFEIRDGIIVKAE